MSFCDTALIFFSAPPPRLVICNYYAVLVWKRTTDAYFSEITLLLAQPCVCQVLWPDNSAVAVFCFFLEWDVLQYLHVWLFLSVSHSVSVVFHSFVKLPFRFREFVLCCFPTKLEPHCLISAFLTILLSLKLPTPAINASGFVLGRLGQGRLRSV